MRKRLLSMLMALAMVVGLFPTLPVTAGAAETVSYLDANGDPQSASATLVTSEMTTWDAGWYYISGTTTITQRVKVNGEVHLILADDATLTIKNDTQTAGGINVSNTADSRANQLHIYGQESGTGQLHAYGNKSALNEVGIGGSNAAITINGGDVYVGASNLASGIGGDGSNVTINGGIIEAYAGNNGAGIGGNGAVVAINGGTIRVRAYHGNGIGDNQNGGGARVILNGGSIHAAAYRVQVADPTNGSQPVMKKEIAVPAGYDLDNLIITDENGKPYPYGLRDVQPDTNNKLYFYLPAGVIVCDDAHTWNMTKEDGKCDTELRCSNCDEIITAAKDHTPAMAVEENRVEETCEQEGSYDEVVYCSVESCKHELSREKKTIPATDHTWSVTYRFAEDGSSCEAKCVCENDATHVETAMATITASVKTDATCTEKGWTTYTATFTEAWAETQTKDVEDIPAKDHAWTVEYAFANDGSSCTATRICGNDAAHNVMADAVEISSQQTKAPTTTAMGETTYTAAFDVEWAETQTKTVADVPMLNQVQIPETQGGTVTVDNQTPAAGDQVTITVTANPGKQLDELTVKDESGTEVTLTKTGDGIYTFTQPEGDVTIEVTWKNTKVTVITGEDCDGGQDCPGAAFTDVNTTLWYHEGIDYALSHGLMNGVGGDKFAPNGTTNRAMIVTILWRLEGEPEAQPAVFSDVANGAWYTDAVAWAAANGIVTGYDADTFGPLDPITREQMAAVLYRYAAGKGYDVSEGEDTNILSYGDADSVSQYAVTAMQWACGEGLINGMDGKLVPQGSATRAQIATILMRFCENVAD